MSEQMKNLAERIELFRDVNDLDSKALADQCRWQKVPKNKQILYKDDLTSDIFFIVEGMVSVRSYSAEGKEVNYVDIGEGELFGEFSAIDGKPRSASVETIRDTVIARMTSKQFRTLILGNAELGLRVAELLVGKTRTLTQRMFEYGTLTVPQRVQHELLRLCDAAGVETGPCTIEPAPTHYEIASRIATHREAVSRELNNLVSTGLIEVGRKRISVKDVERLRNLIL